MKARVDCTSCRKKIYSEAEMAYYRDEHRFFQDSARTLAIYAVCAVLTTMIRRGRTKKYIQQMYDDMCLIFSASDVFGKTITTTDIMDKLEKEYGIDWSKLTVNVQDEKQFLTSMRKKENHT